MSLVITSAANENYTATIANTSKDKIFFIIVILLALILHFVFNNANNDIEPKKILEYYEFANL